MNSLKFKILKCLGIKLDKLQNKAVELFKQDGCQKVYSDISKTENRIKEVMEWL